MDWDSFFAVHSELPREGPGSPEDVAWACALARLAQDAVICDAGSGPGGDVAALLKAAPLGRVVAVDRHFGNAVAARFAGDPRVLGVAADFNKLHSLPEAPFDMIWSAGALYFLGLDAAPGVMARALKPGAVLAFSEPCRFVDAPSGRAEVFFEGYPLRDAAEIAAMVARAGYNVLGQRPVSDDGWEAYYQPMEERIAGLRAEADEGLTRMLDVCAQEARDWRAVRAEVGYVLTVARLT